MRDLNQSDYSYNEPCRWWTRDERDKFDTEELVMRRNESGRFNAKEVTTEQSQNNIVGGTFMFERKGTTIKTPDNVHGMKENDIVEFRDERWIVVSVQKKKAKVQQLQFMKPEACSNFYYIELRK